MFLVLFHSYHPLCQGFWADVWNSFKIWPSSLITVYDGGDSLIHRNLGLEETSQDHQVQQCPSGHGAESLATLKLPGCLMCKLLLVNLCTMMKPVSQLLTQGPLQAKPKLYQGELCTHAILHIKLLWDYLSFNWPVCIFPHLHSFLFNCGNSLPSLL